MSISINNTTINKCIHISFMLIICLINVCSLNAVNDKTINSRSLEETEPGLPLVDDPKYCFEEHYNTVIKAIEKKGIIGKDSDTDKENAKDNFFTITLPDYYTSKEYDVKLTYNLYGVMGANHTTKSINGEAAYGGQLVQVNDTWNKVEEFIAPQSLKTGENEIFFTRRKDENYRYEIEDVSVSLIKKRTNSVFLTENTLKNYNGKIQVIGYASEGIESVAVLGETIRVENGIFEHFLDEFPETTQQLILSFSTIEGETIDKKIPVAYIPADATYEFISKKNGDAVSIKLMDTDKTYNFHALQIETPDKDILEKEATLLLEGLRFKDVIPLNMDVDAVTSGKYLGYGLQLKNQKTQGQIKVHLGYDPSKIPSGYGPKDVRTFAYNSAKREWEVLVVDSLDVKNNVVISKYSGDTDYVNGVIKVPEMAETSSFAPTMIADMEYANPAAGIVNIAPPSANNTGTVSTGFPIKLPAGRNGMQPNLNVTYNSEGGNGWMGLGWNLQLPAITLDTRWGVPRFDETYETEIYQLNGEQLVLKVGSEYTSPHRYSGDITRSNNREFYLRKEGSYLKIVRSGSSPSNYSWVVTDKLGNKSYYGEDNSSVIKDESINANITHWALSKTVDPFGNEVRYFYEKNTTTINGVSAQYFYPSSIEYTMTTGVSNPTYYQVDFTREDANREDINLSARTGVLMTTNHELLSEINIKYSNNGVFEAIRSYQFDYIDSAFKKKQLSKISEYDAAGLLFYSNTMEYYNDTENNNGAIVPSSNVVSISSNEPNTSLAGLIYGIAPDNLELPLGSVLGTSTTSGFSAGLRVGLGLGPAVTKVNNSIGGSYNYSQNKEKTKISFMDINGDGLPDKVYKKNGELVFAPNKWNKDTNEGEFATPRPISGISTLDETKTRTHGFGWDANAVVIGVGKSQSNTKTRTDGYFVDFNGDGLPDMVKDGTVKFNLAKSNSIYTGIEFDNEVDQTENPIVGGGQLHSDIITNIQSELESLNELRANHPQFDHVQSWKAPYTGTITILGDAQLVIKNDCGNDNEDNKFRLKIEHASASQTEGVTTILPNSEKELTEQNQTETYNLTNVSVQKGDVLFFRTHNENYGCGGTVSWSPVVGYPNGSGVIGNAKDENGHTIYRFDSEESFIMNNGGGWTPNAEDITASIAFNLDDDSYGEHQFSDDIRFNVEKITYKHVQSGDNAGDIIEEETESQVWSHTYRSESENGIIDPSPMPSGFTNVQDQYATGGQYSYSYRFYVDSDSNVKWSDINWKPQVSGNDSGTQYPAVSYEIYEDVVNQDFYWVNANTFVQPIINPEIEGDEDKPLMTITHDLFNQETYYPLIGSLEDEAFPIEIHWVVKQKIGTEARTLRKNSFYIYKEDCEFLSCNTFRDASGNIIDPTAQDYDEELSSFNLTKAEVQELKNNAGIVYSAFYINNKAFGIGNTANGYVQLHEDEVANYTYPVKIIRKPFIAKDPTFIGTTYRGWVPFLYNGGVQVSYTEEGEIVLEENGQEATVHFDGNIDMGVFNPNVDEDDINDQINTDNPDEVEVDLNATVTRYTTYQQKNEHNCYTNGAIFNKPIDLDTIDPESFNDSNVIYGYNENNALVSSLGRFGEANLYDLYIDPSTENQNFIGLELISKSVGKAKTLKVTLPLDEDNPTDGPSAGGSGTNSEGHSKTLNQYLDLNGDRYPDIVTEGTIQFTNMDGSLSDKTSGNDFTSGGRNKDVTTGVNIAGMSPNSSESDDNSKTKTSINSGINTGQGKAYDTRLWADINGDGLPDKVTIGSSSVKVRLNTGYSFSDEIVWGSDYMNLKTSTRTNDSNGLGLGGDIDGLAENTSASFAFGFGAGNSTANGNAALIDVNGDGLPDLVKQESNGIFEFHLNTGTHFESDSTAFYSGGQMDENYSLTGNVYGSFTYGFFFTIFGIQIKTTFTPTAGLNAGVNEKRIVVQDINGDGFPDIIEKGDDNTSVTARINKLKKTHKLKSVKNALGGNWTVDYTREGNTFDMPQSQWVLSTIATHDGFTADEGFGTNETLTTVTYSGPKQDRRERDFIGFNKVTIEEQNPSNEAVFRESSQHYHTDNIYLKGALHSSSLKANGTLLSSTSTTYNIMNPEAPETNLYPTTGSEYLQSGLNATSLDKSRLFVAPVKTVSTTHENEGNESLSVEQHFTKYDGYGNLLTYINLGDTYTSAAPTDAYKTEIEYHPSTSMDVDNGVGFAKTIKVSRKNDGALLRQRFATYHKNKLSTITTKLNDTETSTVNLGYDAYGNLEESTSPGGFKTFLEYDEKVHSYPVSVSNSYGETSTSDYDYAFGVPTLVTDTNGQEMRTRIDNRGRLVEVTAPNEMETVNGWTLRMQYQGEDAVPTAFNGSNYVIPAQGSFSWDTAASQTESDAKHHAVTRHYVEDAHQEQLLTVSLIDGMGKAIQLKKTLYANSNASTPLRWLISGKEEKDAFGRILKNYLPTTSTGYPQDPNNLSATVFGYESGTYPSTIDPTIMAYDAKNRVISVNQPGPTQPGENELAIIEYGVEDGMFKTSSTNELNQTMDTYTDVKGRQRKTIRNGELTTEFHYNAIGEKTRVKNHQGYETFYAYDLAGRRLSEKHPDRGLCLYTYDTSGNLVSKQTSNLISGEPQSTINYIYDDYKRRLTEITYPLNSENNVTYAYGASNSLEAKAVNAVGRLFMQTDATGVQGFGYDNLGNLTTHLRGVAAAGKQTFWFNTKWEYDSHNRIKEIIYPDNETVTYNYNQGGNLDNIYRTIGSFEKGDIVTKIKYNDLGERTSIEYGNGTITEYTYDDRRRLEDLKHQFTGFEVTNRYAYDALNNVKSLTTQNPNNSLSTSGQLGGPIQHNYTYDDYNRLVHADGRYTGPNDYDSSLLAQEYNLDMTYDLAHNILSKTQTHVQGAVSNHSNPIATPETMVKTNYHLVYNNYATGNHVVSNQNESFGYVQPHAPQEIIETPDAIAMDSTDPRYKKKRMEYDANGNQTVIKQVVFEGEQGAATDGIVEQKEITLLRNLWDEENRLRAVDTNPEESGAHPIAIYTYDASGERTVRYVPGRVDVKSNANDVSLNERDETMLYPSAMLTAKAQGAPANPDNKGIASYTKHYYMGSERVHSTLGTATNLGLFPSSMDNVFPSIRTLANASVQEATTGVLTTYMALNQNVSLPTPIIEGELTRYAHDKTKYNAYWYHSDHLGSSSYITNLKGVVSQHMEYLPYGGLLVDEHKSSYNTPYKFNAKELDEETGNYYYGARYYNPKFSIWLGVDPLAEQMPEWSSYNYTFSNPIKYTDPDGMAPLDFTLLIAENGAGGQGHMGAIIQDGDGNYHYVTMGAIGSYGSRAFVSEGVSGNTALVPLHGVSSMEEAIELVKKLDTYNEPYTDHVTFSTDSNTDQLIYENIKEKAIDINSQKEKYHFIGNNCTDACERPIEEATGVELPSRPQPNSNFRKIKKDKNQTQKKINRLQNIRNSDKVNKNSIKESIYKESIQVQDNTKIKNRTL